MDINKILISKNHNRHYLLRYISFIEGCKQKNSIFPPENIEKHHILPKSLFPQYKSFKKHPWNCIRLSLRQHLIAHWILSHAYGDKCWAALFMMVMGTSKFNKRHFKVSSRLYEYCKLKLKGVPKSKESIEKLRMKRLGMGLYKDWSGKKYYLHKDDPLIKELGLVGITKGISTKGVNKNMIVCKNKHTGEQLRVTKEEFNSNNDLVGINFGKATTKGKKFQSMLDHDNKRKRIELHNVEFYFLHGYTIIDDSSKGRKCEATGTIWMNNGKENVRCLPTEEEKYTSLGYTRGRVKFVHKKNR